MRFKPTSLRNSPESARRRRAGFTLAEVLAALVFMAIVIPVAVQGLRIANLAGQVAERKAVAARLADNLLNELAVSSVDQAAGQRGTIQEGPHEYQWQSLNEAWSAESVRLLSVQVTFTVQGELYDVALSTLIDSVNDTDTETVAL